MLSQLFGTSLNNNNYSSSPTTTTPTNAVSFANFNNSSSAFGNNNSNSSNIYRVSLTRDHLVVFNTNLTRAALVDDNNRSFFDPYSKPGLYAALMNKLTGAVDQQLYVSSFENLEHTALLILLLSRHKTTLINNTTSNHNNEDVHFLCLASKGKWFTSDGLKMYGALVEKMQQMFHYSMPSYGEAENQRFFAIYDVESKISVSKHSSKQSFASSTAATNNTSSSSGYERLLDEDDRSSSKRSFASSPSITNSPSLSSSFSSSLTPQQQEEDPDMMNTGIEFLYVDCPVTLRRIPHVFHETVRRLETEIDQLRDNVNRVMTCLNESMESTDSRRVQEECEHGSSNPSHGSSVMSDEPIGTIKMFLGSNLPNGWLPCYGQVLNRDEFEQLYSNVTSSHYQFRVSDKQFRLPCLCQPQLPIVASPQTGLHPIMENDRFGGMTVHDRYEPVSLDSIPYVTTSSDRGSAQVDHDMNSVCYIIKAL